MEFEEKNEEKSSFSFTRTLILLGLVVGTSALYNAPRVISNYLKKTEEIDKRTKQEINITQEEKDETVRELMKSLVPYAEKDRQVDVATLPPEQLKLTLEDYVHSKNIFKSFSESEDVLATSLFVKKACRMYDNQTAQSVLESLTEDERIDFDNFFSKSVNPQNLLNYTHPHLNLEEEIRYSYDKFFPFHINLKEPELKDRLIIYFFEKCLNEDEFFPIDREKIKPIRSTELYALPNPYIGSRFNIPFKMAELHIVTEDFKKRGRIKPHRPLSADFIRKINQ